MGLTFPFPLSSAMRREEVKKGARAGVPFSRSLTTLVRKVGKLFSSSEEEQQSFRRRKVHPVGPAEDAPLAVDTASMVSSTVMAFSGVQERDDGKDGGRAD